MTQTIAGQLRQMKPGDRIVLPAKAWTSLKACTLSRLRREFMAERRDWKVGEQDKRTGEFPVVCYTREL